MSAITRDPEIRGGEPCIAGTKTPVAELLAELAGCSVEYKANDYGVSVGLCCEVLLEAAVEYAKFDKQARLLRNIGRIGELYDLLQKAAEAGESDESDI